MSFKSYRKESRNTDWGTNSPQVTLEQLNTGCLLRIADATEAMSKNHVQLQSERLCGATDEKGTPMRIPRETERWLNQMESATDALRDCEADDRLPPTAGSPVAPHQCDGCKSMSAMAHWEVLCPSRVPRCIGTTINYQENATAQTPPESGTKNHG